MARPTLYPRQLVVQIGDDLGRRIEADAEARADKSKSAAARRLLILGAMLDDATKAPHTVRGANTFNALLARAGQVS